ncbi:MAG: hypothetical protein WAN87_06825 [Thermoplasmata archaeon]
MNDGRGETSWSKPDSQPSIAQSGPGPECELATFHRWFRYIAEARAAFLQASSRTPPARLTEDRGASYPSILDVFAKALFAHQDWIL